MEHRYCPNLVLLFLIPFAFQMHRLEAQTLTRGPYLQKVTKNQATIRWRTDQPVKGWVTLTPAGSQTPLTVTENEAVTEHIVTATALAPGIRYAYSIGSGTPGTQGSTLKQGADLFFETANDNGKTRIWLLGDFGNGSDRQKRVLTAYEDYQKKAGFARTDLWLWLGDNAYGIGTEQEFQDNTFNVYGNRPVMLQTPFYAVPGNHDYALNYDLRKSHQIPYLRLISPPSDGEMGGIPSGKKEYYSFNFRNIHVVALDSYGFETPADQRVFYPENPQVTWLKKDLEAARNNPSVKWVIVLWHHPAYTYGSYNSDIDPELAGIRQNLLPVLEQYPVDLVFCGHSHIYERFRMIKGHYGVGSTFQNGKHVAPAYTNASSTGKYEGNGCPYIKKTGNEGTIYVTNGSGGAVSGTQPVWPHPALVYGENKGGSVFLEVSDNRLDYRWISEDAGVKDQFTLFKDVSRKKDLSINYGDSLRLTASWEGSFKWSTGETQSSVSLRPLQSQTFVVKDNAGCLADTFAVKVISPLGMDPGLAKDISVSPNPGKGRYAVGFPPGFHSLEVWSTDGRLLEQHPLTSSPFPLSLLHRPAGAYVLRLSGTGGLRAVRVQKE